MANMSITPNTRELVLKEFDHLLLRRHRLAEFKFTPDQLSRMFFTREEWARVGWLMKNPEAKPVLYVNHTAYTTEIDGHQFMFSTRSSAKIIQKQLVSNKQTVHWDHELGPYFRLWVDAQNKIAEENKRVFGLIKSVMDAASTWPQVKKWWPEITKVTHTFREKPDPKRLWRPGALATPRNGCANWLTETPTSRWDSCSRRWCCRS
jgi:hypothetical protein